METKPTIRYANGAGDTYYIWPDRLQYAPIKPQFSSSGFYDGGDPIDMPLLPEQYEQIKKLASAALSAKDEHIENRVKGSGLLDVEEESCLLAMNSQHKEALEDFLKSLRDEF